MAKGIKKLRLAARQSQADLGAKLGDIPATQISKWERGWEVPPVFLVKEMAILFDCSAADVLGREINIEDEWWNTPYAVTEPELPYGMLRLTHIRGKQYEIPISLRARASILEQIEQCEIIRDNDDLRPWIHAWSLDNRLLFVNPRLFRRIAVIGDDDEQMPSYEHPEVYRTMEKWDELDPNELPTLLREGCERVVAAYPEFERDPSEPHWHNLTVWDDGSEEWDCMIEDEDAGGFYRLALSYFDVPKATLMQINGIGYYKTEYVNLDYVALLSTPLERYLRLSAPHPRRGGDDGDDDPDDDLPEEIAERIEQQLATSVNDNRVGALKR